LPMLVSSIMSIVEGYSAKWRKHKHIKMKSWREGNKSLTKIFWKLYGFHPSDESAELEVLLRESKSDWTVFWRQLTAVVKEFPVHGDKPASTACGDM